MTLEICGALDQDGFRACDRILEEGEACPDHPTAEARVEEYELDAEWMIEDLEAI